MYNAAKLFMHKHILMERNKTIKGDKHMLTKSGKQVKLFSGETSWRLCSLL